MMPQQNEVHVIVSDCAVSPMSILIYGAKYFLKILFLSFNTAYSGTQEPTFLLKYY